MNLIVDVGNTNVKLAVFQNDKIVCKAVSDLGDFKEALQKIISTYHITKAIISSVGKINTDQFKELLGSVTIFELNSESDLPFINNYATPKTLGVDRIALVSAAAKNYSKKNVLIIDAGTCITYDFINKKNEYLGGAISPGIHTRYRSLNNLTANLPLLNKKQPKNLIGNSSKESIHSGVINGILNEIDGTIQQYNQKFKDLTVILTGGDADFLSKQLKSSIFANSNFLLEGLNFILEFNSNE